MPSHKHTIKDIHRLIEPLRDFTPYTLQPYTNEITKDLTGSLQSPTRYIKKLCQAEIVRRIKINPPIYSDNRRFHFYTRKNPKNQEIFYRDIDHRAMLADIALAFNYRYPDCEFKYEENIPVMGDKSIRSDLVVRMEKYIFVIELERSLTPEQIYKKKIKRYEEMKRVGEFKNAKVLFVCAPRSWDFSWRPLQYNTLGAEIAKSKKGIQELIKQAKGCNGYYSFMSFHDFNKIHQSVWFRPSGERCKLLN